MVIGVVVAAEGDDGSVEEEEDDDDDDDDNAEGEETALYSDQLVRSRSALYARRFRPWAFLLAGWVLFFSFGSGIELWSNILLGTLILGTLATPVLHFMGSTKFRAELAALTP